MKNKVKYPVALAIRYIFHKFLLYNQHNERHLKLYIEIIGDIWHSFWDNQKGQNTGGGKKRLGRLLSKNQSKHSKLCKVKAPLVFRMTNLCCFSNGYKSQMLALLWQENISIMRFNMLMFTFSKALLTPADLPAIHFPETVE